MILKVRLRRKYNFIYSQGNLSVKWIDREPKIVIGCTNIKEINEEPIKITKFITYN